MVEAALRSLRTSLLWSFASPDTPGRGWRDSEADAVTFDLASSDVPINDGAAHLPAARALRGHAVHLRVPRAPRGSADSPIDIGLEAIGPRNVAAVLLAGATAPQDIRDADVAIRRHEVGARLEPGTIRLIPELGAASALLALPDLLAATDRCGAVALNVEELADDLGLPAPRDPAGAPFDSYLAQTSLAAAAARLPWLLLAPTSSPGTRAVLASRAHEHGAGGAYVSSEAEVRGLQSLFGGAG